MCVRCSCEVCVKCVRGAFETLCDVCVRCVQRHGCVGVYKPTSMKDWEM